MREQIRVIKRNDKWTVVKESTITGRFDTKSEAIMSYVGLVIDRWTQYIEDNKEKERAKRAALSYVNDIHSGNFWNSIEEDLDLSDLSGYLAGYIDRMNQFPTHYSEWRKSERGEG